MIVVSNFLFKYLDKDGLINTNYFHITTSPKKIIFDRNGGSLKRSHIGPINFYKKDRIFNETNPVELIRELKRMGNTRKEEDESSELRGRHQLSTTVVRNDFSKVTQANSSPFLLVGSPLYKRMRQSQRLLTSSTSKRYQTDNNSNERFVMIEDRSRLNTQEIKHRRTCGCSSAISIPTPKQTFYTQGTP